MGMGRACTRVDSLMRSDPRLIGASQSALPEVDTHRTDAAIRNGTDANEATLLPDLMVEPFS